MRAVPEYRGPSVTGGWARTEREQATAQPSATAASVFFILLPARLVDGVGRIPGARRYYGGARPLRCQGNLRFLRSVVLAHRYLGYRQQPPSSFSVCVRDPDDVT